MLGANTRIRHAAPDSAPRDRYVNLSPGTCRWLLNARCQVACAQPQTTSQRQPRGRLQRRSRIHRRQLQLDSLTQVRRLGHRIRAAGSVPKGADRKATAPPIKSTTWRRRAFLLERPGRHLTNISIPPNIPISSQRPAGTGPCRCPSALIRLIKVRRQLLRANRFQAAGRKGSGAARRPSLAGGWQRATPALQLRFRARRPAPCRPPRAAW